VALLLAPLGVALSACGSGGGGQLAVTLSDTSTGGSLYKAGDTPQLELTVTNLGPGDATGVLVHADMPDRFRYKSTDTTGGVNQTRTQPVDPHVGSNSAGWGLWNLPAPSLQNGSRTPAKLEIDFTVDIEATPDTYNLTARASDDSTTEDVVSKQLSVTVQASPHLGVTAKVSGSNTLKAGDKTRYSITVTNTGTAIAGNVDILVTLPPVVTFQESVTPFLGNASRSKPVDPVKGSIVVFYGGFNIPSASSVGPGLITVVFTVQVVPKPSTGSFPLNVQVTDSLPNEVVRLSSVAPIVVQGGTPSPSGAAATTPSPSPAH
jgi:uncharacterized repeat protein (TIGR01451 family)